MKLTRLFNEFVSSEKSSGILLGVCTVLSLIISNSPFQDSYQAIWSYDIAHHSLAHWINDGLMTIFFLLIGLELEREIYIGELANVRNSLLPIIAAIGGMLVPAAIHFAINYDTPYQRGFGIPMATDIAFALAVLSLLGDKVPAPVKVFLTALAVIDDLGAIIVIAIFYSTSIDWGNLSIAMGLFVFLIALNRFKVLNLIPYLIVGVVMWYFMLHSGIHATITGVLLAFAIPFGDGSEKSPSYILQHFLHKPVAFIILPIFALANTSLSVAPDWYHALVTSNSLGIMLGLVAGKPIGIVSFSYLAIKLRLAALDDNRKFAQIAGVGFLGGIGFTMSIFITVLAFDDIGAIDQSKIAIMISSVIAGIIGYFVLKSSLQSTPEL